jgi:hypothetical protein
MYRDVLVNIRDPDSGLICEVQITLTGIAILKKSEQKIYSIMRMAAGQDLLETFVFSRRPEPSWASVTAFPEHKRVTRRTTDEKTAEDAGSAGFAEEVGSPQGMLPVKLLGPEEIVIQDESDQVLFGNLACAPPSHCVGNEPQVASKVDLLDLQRKVDEQKSEMYTQFDKLSAQNDMLKAQNEMLIEMLKKVELQGKQSSDYTSRLSREYMA